MFLILTIANITMYKDWDETPLYHSTSCFRTKTTNLALCKTATLIQSWECLGILLAMETSHGEKKLIATALVL